jgi:hypothetical protein
VREKGNRILIDPVPVIPPELSAYWLRSTSDVQ